MKPTNSSVSVSCAVLATITIFLAGIVHSAPDQIFSGSLDSCGGVVKAGSCFWFGQNNQSCDTVCSIHGGYALGSRYLAGSDGDAAVCGELLTALSAINPLPVTEQASILGIVGMGCASDYTTDATSYRFTSTTTSVASSASNGSLYVRRVCACAG